MWDTEVDLVCIGAGIGGLASAIATVNAGGDVIVADTAPDLRGVASSVTTRGRVGAVRGWLQHDGVDVDTDVYLSAVAEGLDPLARRADAALVPTRVARAWSADERSVEPFIGATIRAWDAQCLGSPYGMLYTTVFGWRRTRMRSSDGESIEVMPIGEMDWHDGLDEHDLLDWMEGQARERDVEVLAASRLQRLVFEEGLIVGVVLDTPDGPYAVRAHRGVALSPRDHRPAAGDRLADPSPGERKQVCLVGRAASRFGRVELVTIAAPTAVAEPVCKASGRQLRGNLRESRQVPSDAWRCGKVHGHTTFGQ
jgi:succinate dehydrogenase/fumarate reductase flavoprotein subunit